jgi:hypothetical protein
VRDARLLSSSWAGAAEAEDVAHEALEALLSAAPRVEAQGRKLERLPAALPLSRGARLQRLTITKGLRGDLTTALAASDVVLEVGREPREGGRLPKSFVEVLQERSDATIVLVQTVKSRHATEEAILGVDAAAKGLLPDELALLSEVVESARASLAWVRKMITRPERLSPSRMARRARQRLRAFASIWWALDLIEEVNAEILLRASPRSPLTYHLDRLGDRQAGTWSSEHCAPQTARPAWTLGQVARWLLWGARRFLLWRKGANALRAYQAVSALYEALREEAGYASRFHSTQMPGPRRDPRTLPPGDEPSTATDADLGMN